MDSKKPAPPEAKTPVPLATEVPASPPDPEPEMKAARDKVERQAMELASRKR